jgi:hypothetical protein
MTLGKSDRLLCGISRPMDIGLAISHSTYDTLYLAFAIAIGAVGVVVSDGPFVRDMKMHPDPVLAGMLIPLDAWARSRDIT